MNSMYINNPTSRAATQATTPATPDGAAPAEKIKAAEKSKNGAGAHSANTNERIKSTERVKGAKSDEPGPGNGRRIQVRRSGVHGKGVFAVQSFKKGELVIEYTGEVITWKEALRRHPHDPNDPNHTFYFHIDNGHVIDGKHKGNAAKWINHSCAPNCEADEDDGRVFVRTLRRIAAGEELNYDYGLILEGRHTPKVKKEYECRCGSRKCRGTMLAPKR